VEEVTAVDERCKGRHIELFHCTNQKSNYIKQQFVHGCSPSNIIKMRIPASEEMAEATMGAEEEMSLDPIAMELEMSERSSNRFANSLT